MGGFTTGPLLPAAIFGALCIALTLAFQWEHARSCYVMPLQRNAARLYILAPVYSIFIFLTATVTSAKPAWDVSMSVLDGYALYVFFGLVVLGAGGEEFVIAQLAHVMARARRTGVEAVAASDAEAAGGTAVVVGREGEGEEDSDEDSDLEREFEDDNEEGAGTASAGSSTDGAAGSGGQGRGQGQRRHQQGQQRRAHGGPVTYKCCFCVPLHYRSARKLYAFLKRSITQLMVTRPIFLALSAMCEFGAGRPAHAGVRLFRVCALGVLVYAVLTIARVYHLVQRQLWAAFNPVTTFMVVKGFILALTVQDFLIAMIFSVRDPHYRSRKSHEVLQAYSLVVGIEALVYLLALRQLIQPRVFASYSPRAAIPVRVPFFSFLREVYALASGVIEGPMPPPEKQGESGPGIVGPEEYDSHTNATDSGGSGGSGHGVEIRVLQPPSSAGGMLARSPSSRRR